MNAQILITPEHRADYARAKLRAEESLQQRLSDEDFISGVVCAWLKLFAPENPEPKIPN